MTPSAPLYACVRAPGAAETAVAIARDFSPRWQRYPCGRVVLDVGGLGRLLGDAPAIGAELQRACARRAADRRVLESIAVAVAPSQIAALLLCGTATGRPVVVDDPAAALSPLAIDLLRQLLAAMHGAGIRRRSPTAASAIWDAYADAFAVLQRWGVATLGALAALPPHELSARLGQTGVALQQQARGIDRQPLVPDPEVQRFVARIEIEWPIDGLEPLAFVLARLIDPLSAALERADRAAAAIRLDLRLVDRTVHTRQLQLPAVMRDPRVLRTLLVLDLESHPPAAAIDVVTVEIDPAPGRIVQYSLLERATPSAETLATLTARLSALVGETRCGAAVLCDSHRPDAFTLHRFGSHPPGRAPAFTPPGMARAAPDERVVLRRFRPPIAIRVAVDRGRPAQVAIDRRGMPGGRVEQCAGPWRSSGVWWDPQARGWDRDEWDVALSDGSVCRLFRARDAGGWFLEGVVD
jgi:protein ImuB